MIYGNKRAQEILSGYFEKIKQEGKIPFNFLLLDGPSRVGKTTLAKDLSEQILGDCFDKDFLGVYDFSEHLGKRHSLKIENKESNKFLNVPEYGQFEDMGVREISVWLSKSSFGKFKILFLENIERMTVSASNAFLKTFEEPLENRLIIATTSNSGFLLDTIISRAFIVRFSSVDDNTIYEFLRQEGGGGLDKEYMDFLVYFSMGKIGFAKKLLQQSEDQSEFKKLKELFEKFINIYPKEGFLREKSFLLMEVEKMGYLNIFLDVFVSYLSRKYDYKGVNRVLKTKSMMNANVSKENAIFYLLV